ncbi:MAG: serine hydrolase domain-containing protein [Caldilineaceae bacterium]
MNHAIPVSGTCDPQFVAVHSAFEENFQQANEIGAAVAVYYQRRPVVDLWSGYADLEQNKPWQKDTIVNVWSVTKAIVALCALRLVEQGKLDLDAPVARYWPEFAQAGKDLLPVRHLLNHQAGLAAIDETLSTEAIFDWERMTQLLERQRPWWTPGTAHGYHAVTFGWLVGELVRRVSNKSIGRFLREEIALPLAVDFQIGFGSEQDDRVATVVNQSQPAESKAEQMNIDPNSLLAKVNNPPLPDFSIFNSRAWRSAELPSANGTTNARALARIYGALACDGELDGVRLLSSDLLGQATAISSSGIDIVFGFRSCIGLGFHLNRPAGFMGPNEAAFGLEGYGGSIGFADPVTGLGFGYVTNGIRSDPAQFQRAAKLIHALYQLQTLSTTSP